jgi:hypothetical protein
MKKLLLLGVALVLAATLTGCGDGSDNPPTVVVGIFSSPSVDGDISFDGVNFTPATASGAGAGTVLAGIDAIGSPEFRGFLTFPLDAIPTTATIVSATLEITINEVILPPLPSTSVPMFLDLVSFSVPPGLTGSFEYNQSPITFRTIDFFSTDVGKTLIIDVTNLMREAQARSLFDFQVRFVLETSLNLGLIGIEDPTTTTPHITVEYF